MNFITNYFSFSMLTMTAAILFCGLVLFFSIKQGNMVAKTIRFVVSLAVIKILIQIVIILFAGNETEWVANFFSDGTSLLPNWVKISSYQIEILKLLLFLLVFFLTLILLFRILIGKETSKEYLTRHFWRQFIGMSIKVPALLCLSVFFILYFDYTTSFLLRNYNLFDWLIYENITKLNFHKGFYFSLATSTLLSVYALIILLINLKSRTDIVLNILFLTIILSLGFFISIFSIVNMLFNIYSFPSLKDWFIHESSIGLFTVRVTSLVVLFGFLKYTFNHVFNSAIVLEPWYLPRIKKYDPLSNGATVMSNSSYSTVYFAQMGFYILSLLILFYTFRITYQSPLVSILNWSLFFIIDDWAIIYVYIYKTGKTISFNRNKIRFFNAALFTLNILILLKLIPVFYVVIYIITVLLLFGIWLNNYKQITVL